MKSSDHIRYVESLTNEQLFQLAASWRRLREELLSKAELSELELEFIKLLGGLLPNEVS